jgi:dienelactone hydrolase
LAEFIVVHGEARMAWRSLTFIGSSATWLISSAAFAQSVLPLPMVLTKPAGDGPFPAIVILHDCSGLGPNSSGGPWRWSTRLNAAGYVTVAPDSFSTRGHPDGVCTDPSPPVVRFIDRARDAYAALDYAQSLPFVDAARVALMGGSHGGAATMSAMVEGPLGARRAGPGFIGAVALYPGCGRSMGDWKVTRDPEQNNVIAGMSGVFRPRAPLLILVGELDDWTPAEPCRDLVEAAQAQGLPIDIKIYPGARHSFDSPRPVRYIAERVNSNAPGGRGATTGGDRAAWDDAVERVLDFFAARRAAVK